MQTIVSRRASQDGVNGLKTATLRHLGSAVITHNEKGRKSDLVERVFDTAGINTIKNRVDKARKAKAVAGSIAAGFPADAKVSYTRPTQWDVYRGIAERDAEFLPTDEEMMKFGNRIKNLVGYSGFFTLRDVEELFTELLADSASDVRNDFISLEELDNLELRALEVKADETDNSTDETDEPNGEKLVEQIINQASQTA